MPLDFVVEKLDAVPEALRSEYTKSDSDGKFHLNVNGYEDPVNLKKALKTERDAAAAAAAEVATWKKLGKSPDEIATLISEKDKAAEEALKKAGKFDEVLEGHKKQWLSETASLRDTLTKERDAAINSERKAVVETKVVSALTAGRATQAGVELLTDRLASRIKFEIDSSGNRQLQILDANGSLMIGSGKDGQANFEDLVKEAQKAYPALFEATGVGGTGTDPRGTRKSGSTKTMTRAEFEKVPVMERSALVTKQGYQIVD